MSVLWKAVLEGPWATGSELRTWAEARCQHMHWGGLVHPQGAGLRGNIRTVDGWSPTAGVWVLGVRGKESHNPGEE